MRSILAVLLGLVVGFLVVVAIELVSHRLYPLPAGIDPSDAEALAAAVAQMPLGAFLLLLAAWLGGTLLGSWIASRVGRGYVPGIVVGALFLIAGIANLLMIPHPVWFWAAAVVVFIVATFLGTRLGAPLLPPPPAETGRTA